MATESFSDQLVSALQPSGDEKKAACEASKRLSENVMAVSKDNSDINYQMNNGRVECYPPPITPRCRFEEIPPDSGIVTNRVNDMITREQSMHNNLSQISPVVAGDPKLAKELNEVNNRLQALEMETNKLYELTSAERYNEGAIDKENRVIGKLTKSLEESRKTLSRDMGCDAGDAQRDLVKPEHETVFCDVAMKPKQVWKQIGTFDALPWHPGIQSGSLSEDGKIRSLVADGGVPTFTEELIGQGEDRKTGERYYTYKMAGGLPVQPISTLRVEPHGKGSRITWTAEMDLSDLDEQTAQAVSSGIKGFYQQGLSALMEKLNKK